MMIRRIAPRLRRPAIVLAVLAAVLCAVWISMAAPRASSAPGNDSEPKPTVVLVHGAWADASSWSGVAERLQGAGYPVVATPNPLRSLAGDAAYLEAILATIEGPIILAAHSYGGAVITNAATGNANVKALVYVDAFIPDQGQFVLELLGPDSVLAADPATVFKVVPYPGGGGDLDTYLLTDVFLESFAPDVPRNVAAAMAASQRPLALGAGLELSGPPAWESIPSFALVGTGDAVIPPDRQRAMAEHAGAQIVEVRASHASLVSRPEQVVRLIESAAAEVGD